MGSCGSPRGHSCHDAKSSQFDQVERALSVVEPERFPAGPSNYGHQTPMGIIPLWELYPEWCDGGFPRRWALPCHFPECSQNREYGHLRVSWAFAPSVVTTNCPVATLSPLLYRALRWYADSRSKASGKAAHVAGITETACGEHHQVGLSPCDRRRPHPYPVSVTSMASPGQT